MWFRFLCATSAVGNNARLDFDGERRVWNGATIKKKAKGNRCLYIVPEVEVYYSSLKFSRSLSEFDQKYWCLLKYFCFRVRVELKHRKLDCSWWAVLLPQNMQSTSTHGGFQPTQQYQLQSVATLMAGTQVCYQKMQLCFCCLLPLRRVANWKVSFGFKELEVTSDIHDILGSEQNIQLCLLVLLH